MVNSNNIKSIVMKKLSTLHKHISYIKLHLLTGTTNTPRNFIKWHKDLWCQAFKATWVQFMTFKTKEWSWIKPIKANLTIPNREALCLIPSATLTLAWTHHQKLETSSSFSMISTWSKAVPWWPDSRIRTFSLSITLLSKCWEDLWKPWLQIKKAILFRSATITSQFLLRIATDPTLSPQ